MMNKNIFKNSRIGVFTMMLALASVISLGVIMQSCSKDDYEEKPYAEYLDLDVYKTTSAFTPSELGIIQKAAQRIAKYSIFDGEKFERLDKKTLKQINVSERLYSYMYPGMQKSSDLVKSPRLKLKSESKTVMEGTTTTVTTTYSHAETVDLFNTANTILLHAGYWSNYVKYFGIPIGAIVYLESITWSNLQSTYGDSTKGCQFITTQIFDPMSGTSFIMYQIIPLI